jgi:alpha-ketoglutarate-dependent 2,4-dichlorophenoxyacetate dioxygenase
VEHATRAAFVHVHQWRVHDVVMRDNRQTVRRARAFETLREARTRLTWKPATTIR